MSDSTSTTAAAPPGAGAVSIERGKAARGGYLLFGLFALCGGGLLIPMWGWTTMKVVQARQWAEVDCEILSSRVAEEDDGESTTYRITVTYRYRVQGQDFVGNRYKFMFGSSGGRARKEAVVARLPPGKRTVCYVNPRRPDESVLVRGFTADMLFGLIPLLFLVIGVVGAVQVRTGWPLSRWRTASGAAWLPATRGQAAGAWAGEAWVNDATGSALAPLELRPASHPVGAFLAIVGVTVFWNGIVSVFLHQAWKGFQAGRPEWFLIVFLTPFVLVGALLIGSIGYFFLALLNPRPVLTLSCRAPRLGQVVQLDWRWRGWLGRLRRVRITLEGREEATFQNGEDTTTAKSVFARHDLLDTTDPLELTEGRVEFNFPEDSMHSFQAKHNKVLWQLKLQGEIRLWPDVTAEFPLVVRPRASRQELA